MKANKDDGQISLRKTDVAMNSIFQKLTQQIKKSELEKTTINNDLPEKLQGYLHSECQLPLPLYQDGGVFNSYINTNSQLYTNLASQPQQPESHPRFVETAKIKTHQNNTDIADELRESFQSTNLSQQVKKIVDDDRADKFNSKRPSTQLEALGKVHLTKQQMRDREIFLNVSSSKRGKSKEPVKDLAGANTVGNNSLQKAWNTTGFLPVQINPNGQKNSVKDFEYLKFLNDTILKDEVLTKFMTKAGEVEMAAGSQANSKSPKKQPQLTPLQRIQSIQTEFKNDPSKFRTCTNFDALLDPNRSKRNNARRQQSKISKEREDNGTDLQTVEQSQKNYKRRSQSRHHTTTDQRSTSRHKNCAAVFQSKFQKNNDYASPKRGQQNSQQKKRGENNNTNKRSSRAFATHACGFQINRELTNSNQNAPVGFGSSQARMHLQQAKIGKQSKLVTKRSSIESAREITSRLSTAGAISRRVKHQVTESDGYFDLNDQRDKLINELKRASADLSPSRHFNEAFQNRTSTMNVEFQDSTRRVVKTRAQIMNVQTQDLERSSIDNNNNNHKRSVQNNYRAVSQALSPKSLKSHKSQLSKKSGRSGQQKLITNITGRVTDKLKLTTRLNAAVDDLIRMGQKYREKSQVIAQQIPMTNMLNSVNQSSKGGSTIRNLEESKMSSVNDIQSSQNPSTMLRIGVATSQNRPRESSLNSIDEIPTRSPLGDDKQYQSRQRGNYSQIEPVKRFANKAEQHQRAHQERVINNKTEQHEPVKAAGKSVQRRRETEQDYQTMKGKTKVPGQAAVYVSFDATTAAAKQNRDRSQHEYNRTQIANASVLEPIIVTTTENKGASFDDRVVKADRQMDAIKRMALNRINKGNSRQKQLETLQAQKERASLENSQSSFPSLTGGSKHMRDSKASPIILVDHRQQSRAAQSNTSIQSFKRQHQNNNLPAQKADNNNNSVGTLDSAERQTRQTGIKRIYQNKQHISVNQSSTHSISQEQLTQIHQKQSKTMAKTVIASQKRKINQLSNLQPILNTNSKDEITLPNRLTEKTFSLDEIKNTDSNQVTLQPLEGIQKSTKKLAQSSEYANTKSSDEGNNRKVNKNNDTKRPESLHGALTSKFDFMRHGSVQHEITTVSQMPLTNPNGFKSTLSPVNHIPNRLQTSFQTYERQQKELRQNAIVYSDHSIVSSNQNSKPRMSKNAILQKDDAIEMIQTGPPEAFSSVLRHYLSSQHQASLTQHYTDQRHQKSKHAQYQMQMMSKQSKTTTSNEQIIPVTQFTKAQQNLLSKNATGKRSIISDQHTTNRRNIMRAQSINGAPKPTANIGGSGKSNSVFKNLVGNQMQQAQQQRQMLQISKPVRQVNSSHDVTNLIQASSHQRYHLQHSLEATMPVPPTSLDYKETDQKSTIPIPTHQQQPHQSLEGNRSSSRRNKSIDHYSNCQIRHLQNNQPQQPQKQHQQSNEYQQFSSRRADQMKEAYNGYKVVTGGASLLNSSSVSIRNAREQSSQKNRKSMAVISSTEKYANSIILSHDMSMEESELAIKKQLQMYKQQQATQNNVTSKNKRSGLVSQMKNPPGQQKLKSAGNHQKSLMIARTQSAIKDDENPFPKVRALLQEPVPISKKQSDPVNNAQQLAKQQSTDRHTLKGGRNQQCGKTTKQLSQVMIDNQYYPKAKSKADVAPIISSRSGSRESLKSQRLVNSSKARGELKQAKLKINESQALESQQTTQRVVQRAQKTDPQTLQQPQTDQRQKRRNIVIAKETSNKDSTTPLVAPSDGQRKEIKVEDDYSDERREEQIIEVRPRLCRPSFLNEPQNMEILLKEKATQPSIISTSQRDRTLSPEPPVKPAGSIYGLQNFEALRKRFGTADSSDRTAALVGSIPNNEVAVEERLIGSSIMAMQIDGGGDRAEMPQVRDFKSLFGVEPEGGCSN